MNTIFQLIGCTITAVGMQLALAVQPSPFSTALATPVLDRVQIGQAGSISPMLQDQGDSPDMGDREGVPPSTGSGSR